MTADRLCKDRNKQNLERDRGWQHHRSYQFLSRSFQSQIDRLVVSQADGKRQMKNRIEEGYDFEEVRISRCISIVMLSQFPKLIYQLLSLNETK